MCPPRTHHLTIERSVGVSRPAPDGCSGLRPAGRSRWAGNDRELRQPSQHEAVAVAPAQFVVGDGEAQLGEPPHQRAERELAFDAGQRRTQAEVSAVAEGEMPARWPTDIERLWVGEVVAI